MDDFYLPAITNFMFVFALFAASLVILHGLLVYPRNLSKRGWKFVDYIWLTFGWIGLIGSIANSRMLVSKAYSESIKIRVDNSKADVLSIIQFGHGPAICRQFIPNDFFPRDESFDRLQKEFDEECAWFKEASNKANSSPLNHGGKVSITDLGGPIPEGGDRWPYAELARTIERYNSAVDKFEGLSKSAHPSGTESLFTVVGPSLLAMALALRITKVTGELRYEPTIDKPKR